MLNIGGWELLIILLLALVVLGPERLPEAARQIGRVTREVRKVTTGFQKELQDAMKDPVSTAAGTDVTSDAAVPSDPFTKPEGKSTAVAAAGKGVPGDAPTDADEPTSHLGDHDDATRTDPSSEGEGEPDADAVADEPPMPSDR